jgi:Na+/H+-dicarboxylate symporter
VDGGASRVFVAIIVGISQIVEVELAYYLQIVQILYFIASTVISRQVGVVVVLLLKI